MKDRIIKNVKIFTDCRLLENIHTKKYWVKRISSLLEKENVKYFIYEIIGEENESNLYCGNILYPNGKKYFHCNFYLEKKAVDYFANKLYIKRTLEVE